MVYKLCHEDSQKTLNLTEASEYLGTDPDRKVQARNLFNKVSSVFQEIVFQKVPELRYGAKTRRSIPSS